MRGKVSPSSQVLSLPLLPPAFSLPVTARCWCDRYRETPSSSAGLLPRGFLSWGAVPAAQCPSLPLPASPVQTNKPGAQPVTAVGPQGLFDQPRPDGRKTSINTRLLCTYFNSIFVSGHAGISATCFYFHPKFPGLFTPSSYLLEPTRSSFQWLSQKHLFALCGLAQSKAGLFS